MFKSFFAVFCAHSAFEWAILTCGCEPLRSFNGGANSSRVVVQSFLRSSLSFLLFYIALHSWCRNSSPMAYLVQASWRSNLPMREVSVLCHKAKMALYFGACWYYIITLSIAPAPFFFLWKFHLLRERANCC